MAQEVQASNQMSYLKFYEQIQQSASQTITDEENNSTTFIFSKNKKEEIKLTDLGNDKIFDSMSHSIFTKSQNGPMEMRRTDENMDNNYDYTEYFFYNEDMSQILKGGLDEDNDGKLEASYFYKYAEDLIELTIVNDYDHNKIPEEKTIQQMDASAKVLSTEFHIYDEKGNRIKAYYDLNGDENIDATFKYEYDENNKVIKRYKDTNGDNKYETCDTYENGKIVKTEELE